MRSASRVAAPLLAATAVAGIFIATLILAGTDVDRAVPALPVRVRDPIRPHDRLAARPGNVVVARYHSVFLDGIRVMPAQP